ncbi:MAG: A/G-specific adenine glycosylase [Gammaproteobacteria bacterium]
MKRIIKIFTDSLLNWYWEHGRQNLPWQNPYDAYRVWVSEIMLQQTQVKTVIPYFLNFMQRFPDIHTLAQAPLDDVLAAWSGLGYYSRARNLHRTAQEVVNQYQGIFPDELSHLQNLPGIGRSTAAAIASLAFEHPTAILDGNVKRVLSRYFKIAGTDRTFETQLWELTQACMPQKECRAYTQAIMDLGALCCTLHRPNCSLCPLRTDCRALHANVVQDYPEKKPKKTRPTRHEQFIVLYSTDHQIYLEQRPLSGIWGGLWCLPSISQDIDINEHLNATYIVTTDCGAPFMIYKHSFTHFHLHIKAYSIQISPNSTLPGSWYTPSSIDQLGLAKPVKDIIHKFISLYSNTP